MKNYALTDEEKSLFIKNYEYVGDKIKVNYGDGSSCDFANDIRNEKELLKRMRKQVLEADVFEKETIRIKNMARSGILLVFIVASSLTIFTIPFANSIVDLLVVELATLIFVSPAFITFSRIFKRQKELLKDIYKNQLFIKNEVLFQTEITKDMKLDKSVAKETKDVIDSIIKSKEESIVDIEHPTINEIDAMSYDSIVELCNILNNDCNKKNKVLTRRNIH